MQSARTVLLIPLLVCGLLSPPQVWGQGTEAPPPTAEEPPPVAPSDGFQLEQNYPSPVNPETWIPFTLEEDLVRSGDTAVVTVRIFNILSQLVAVPKAVNYEQKRSPPILNLPYTEPGRKLAYWNGRDLAGKRVPTGVYYTQLVVNGRPQIRKLTVLNPRRRRSIFPWFGRN